MRKGSPAPEPNSREKPGAGRASACTLGRKQARGRRLDEAERAIRKTLELQRAATSYHHQLAIIEIPRGKAAALAVQHEPAGV